MKGRTLAQAMVAVGFLGGSALAEPPKQQQQKQAPPSAMSQEMAAMEKAATPGPEHKLLARTVGSWTTAIKTWMEPGRPPMESKGTAEVKPILGGRFFEMTAVSTFGGQPFEGRGWSGYDNVKKKFIGAWVDSFGTSLTTSEGSVDAAGKTFTSMMTEVNPATGQEQKARDVLRIESDKQMVEEFFHRLPDGREAKMMEIVYTRK